MNLDIAGASYPAAPITRQPMRSTEPNATLLERTDLTPSMAIFRVRPDVGVPPFEPGQYFALGLTVDGRLIQRPYSTASARGTASDLEFLVRCVPGGSFTPTLWAMPIRSRLRIGPPKGLFHLDRGDTRTHLLVATGTGLAPFMSMVRSSPDRPHPPRIIVVHGASQSAELAYQNELRAWERAHPNVHYQPVLSRPPGAMDRAWTGPIGRLDATLGPICSELAVDPADTVAYLCGNPAMIAATESLLAARGFPADAIRSEGYWVP